MVKRLKEYGIETTEKELMKKEKARLIKSLKDAYESGYSVSIVRALKELEELGWGDVNENR